MHNVFEIKKGILAIMIAMATKYAQLQYLHTTPIIVILNNENTILMHLIMKIQLPVMENKFVDTV